MPLPSGVPNDPTAARLLDQGFAMPDPNWLTVAAMPAYGDTMSANDMHDEICKKKAPEEQSEAAPPVAAKDVPKSPYQEKLDHVPTLVAVGLGGATGPAPKAMLDQGGQEFADVPLPSWRPDIPAPKGSEPVVVGSATPVQGDQPVKAAN